jgi:hypothetical protein
MRNTWLNQPSNRWRFKDADSADDGSGDGDVVGDVGSGDVGGGPADQTPANYFKSVPDDWRQQIAGEDKAKLNQLQRLGDFGAFADTYFESQNKIRSGQIGALQAPGEDATPEELTEYRDAIGVPATADAYEMTLTDGLVIGEADQPMMTAVYEAAHAANVPTAQVNAMANALFKAREIESQTLATKQEQYRVDATQVLKQTWANGYTTNMSMISNVIINSLPEAVREQFTNAVMPDGRALLNSPEVLVAMADWARKIDPAATVVTNDPNPAKTIDNELKALKAKMGTSEWFKDEAAQQRYRDLLDAKEKMG